MVQFAAIECILPRLCNGRKEAWRKTLRWNGHLLTSRHATPEVMTEYECLLDHWYPLAQSLCGNWVTDCGLRACGLCGVTACLSRRLAVMPASEPDDGRNVGNGPSEHEEQERDRQVEQAIVSLHAAPSKTILPCVALSAQVVGRRAVVAGARSVFTEAWALLLSWVIAVDKILRVASASCARTFALVLPLRLRVPQPASPSDDVLAPTPGRRAGRSVSVGRSPSPRPGARLGARRSLPRSLA